MPNAVPAIKTSPTKKAASSKPAYDTMIVDAIKKIKDSKGVHWIAICNLISNKYLEGQKPKAAILAKNVVEN